MLDPQAFQGATVLITGHTGFKGGWLSLYLERLGAEVVGYSLAPPTQPSLFVQAGLQTLVTHIQGDIRDQAKLIQTLERHRPDFVFHMAAQPLVLESYRDPVETYDVNVLGSVKLLEAVRQTQLRTHIIMVVTDKCYQNKEWAFGYRETDALGGYDPYSASKAAMDIAVQSYRLSFFPAAAYDQHGVAVATVRSGNVIGGGDWADNRIVPDAVRAFMQNHPLSVRNPHAVRPWQHVLEPLYGYLMLAAKLAEDPCQYVGAWNFGPLPTDVNSVGELADAMTQTWGGGTSWEDVSTSAAQHEAGLLRLSIDKAVSHLGWRPVWDFRTTVAQTIIWYRAAVDADTEAIRALCNHDIEHYEQAANALM